MRAAIVTFLIAAAVAAHARPDVSLGYKYNTPQDQYAGATPDHSAFAAIGGLSGGHQQTEHGYQQQQSQFSSIPSTVSSYVSSGSIGGSASGSGNVYQTGGYQQQQHQISGSVPSTATTYVSSSSNSAAAGNAYQTGGISSTVASGLAQNQYYSNSGAQSAHTYTGSAATTTSGGSIVGTSSSFVQPATYSTSSSSLSSSSGSSSSSASGAARLEASALPPIITKSFYFEAAPEEPEEQQGPRFVPVGRAQKNYKVIFIKAPSYGLNSQIIPVVPQNEEKTIIYVLSKKPEFNQDIELPPVPTTEPSKPEIFFVKYKSEQEALEAQHKIKNVYETNQPSVEGDARFDDQHIHTIVSEAVPNVYSAASGVGSGHQSGGSINAVRQHLSVNGNIGSVGSGASFSRLEQRFGGAEEESQVQAAEQQSNVHAEGGSASAGGYTLVSEQVQDNSAGHENVQSAHQSGAISSIGDGSSSAGLISVNFVDLNNAGAVETAAAAAEHVLGGGEAEPEYLPPNHGHY